MAVEPLEYRHSGQRGDFLNSPRRAKKPACALPRRRGGPILGAEGRWIMKTVIGGAALLLVLASAQAGEGTTGITNETTQGRELVKATRPQYPPSENGRWTASCVSLFFTVRPDGKTDRFVVLEAPRYARARAEQVQTDAEKLAESRLERKFIQNDLQALLQWEYAPGPKATEEIAVFDFRRTEMGGHLMNLTIRRTDLGAATLRGCDALDPKQVMAIVEKARGKAG
jgi:hypothetical protein